MGSDPPTPTITASSICAPNGISIEGKRQVTGSEEPPSIGNFSFFEAATIDLRFFEAVGEVLVVIDGNGAAALFENLDALFEELVARVEDLAFVVPGIVAVFADDQHSIAGQAVPRRSRALQQWWDRRENRILCARSWLRSPSGF